MRPTQRHGANWVLSLSGLRVDSLVGIAFSGCDDIVPDAATSLTARSPALSAIRQPFRMPRASRHFSDAATADEAREFSAKVVAVGVRGGADVGNCDALPVITHVLPGLPQRLLSPIRHAKLLGEYMHCARTNRGFEQTRSNSPLVHRLLTYPRIACSVRAVTAAIPRRPSAVLRAIGTLGQARRRPLRRRLRIPFPSTAAA